MIKQLNRIDIAVTDLPGACAAYADLFGVAPHARAADSARFRLANTDVLLQAAGAILPHSGGEGLCGMAFGVDDLERAARLLDNRGVAWTRESGPDGPRLRLDSAASHGAPVTLEPVPARDTRREAETGLTGAGAVVGVDHLVLRSANPTRAMAFWGARMGLSLRFDRTFPQMGARVTLFRCGDMKIEVASREDPAKAEQDDELWGVSWRAADIAGLHARLAGGFDLSEVRRGLEPGTAVFTIRNRTHGVATIAIGARQLEA
ncbi:VOC family protein [Camelimonas lactis]|uniref:VOC domain-containing protein n=1 Tax=Camelimonas lactis TaxID=659006 RepID=A0A4R2GXL6_9HYPH|nr:VOC family protein [Camelimonas lactis]TCO15981.1 hypothetical protein EV666_101231 [Camelimonas lactis]